MKCPKCGSERIQFGTNTHGGGFSCLDSCCGMIALGPLGLLCGACGSGTTTDEFWVCQDCGHKFTTQKSKEKELQDQQAAQEYEKNKRIIGNQSSEQVQAENKRAHNNYSNADKAYRNLLNKYATGNNVKLRKAARIIRREWSEVLAWVVGIICVIAAFLGAIFCLVPLIFCIMYLIIYKKQFKKAELELSTADPNYTTLKRAKDIAYKAVQNSDEKMDASKKVDRYENKK